MGDHGVSKGDCRFKCSREDQWNEDWNSSVGIGKFGFLFVKLVWLDPIDLRVGQEL